MKFVIDANILLSALIADSTTRSLLVELDHRLLTPAYVYDEINEYRGVVAEKSGLAPREVDELVERLGKQLTIVPRGEILDSLHEAARIMQEIDPDDALYLATALKRDAYVWSDDGDLHEQELVSALTTGEIIERFG